MDNNDYKECENFDQIWLSIIGKVEDSVHENIPSLKDMMEEKEKERKIDPPQLTEKIKKAFTSVDGVFKTYFTTIRDMMKEKINNNGGGENPHNKYALKFCHIVDDVLESKEPSTETETKIYKGLKFLFDFKIEVSEEAAPAATAPADEAPAAPAPAPAPADEAPDGDGEEDEEEEEGEEGAEGGSVKNLIERYNEGEDPLKKIIGCIFDIGKYAIDVSSLNKTAFDSIGDNLSELVTRVTPLQGQNGGGFFRKWSNGQKFALLACCCVFALGFCIMSGGGGVAVMGPALFYLTQAVTSVSVVVAGGIIIKPMISDMMNSDTPSYHTYNRSYNNSNNPNYYDDDEDTDDDDTPDENNISLFNFLNKHFNENRDDTTCIVLVKQQHNIKYMFIKKEKLDEENEENEEYRYYYRAVPNTSNTLDILNATSGHDNYIRIDNNYGNKTEETYIVVGPNDFNDDEKTEIIKVLGAELVKYRFGGREHVNTLKSFLSNATGYDPNHFGGMRRKRNNIYKKNNKMTKRKRRATINKQKRAAAAKTTRKRRTTIKKRKCGAVAKTTRKRRATSIKFRQRKTKKNYK